MSEFTKGLFLYSSHNLNGHQKEGHYWGPSGFWGVSAAEWLSHYRGFYEESLQWALFPKEGPQGGHLKGRELQEGHIG